jgi:hypothetical protein
MTTFNSRFATKVDHLGGVTTTLNDVQNVVITQGRSNLSDTYRSAVVTIEGRNPSGLPNIKIGDELLITIQAYENNVLVSLPSYETERTGRVTNIEIDYGIVPNMDTWRITTEDAIAILGRQTVNVTVNAGTVTGDAAKQITDAAGVTMTIAGSSIPSPSTVKATTFVEANALDAFQTYANTEMAYVVQQGDELLWVPRQGWTYTGSAATFSDEVPLDPSYLQFQSLNVSNLSDAVAQEVLISIRGGNTISTGAGATYLQLQTYDSSDAQALSLGQYVKALFTNEEPVPYSLSYMFTGQDPELVLEPVATELRQITLEFRGETSQAIVLGVTISINPDVAYATLNLLAIDQIPLFQLDILSNGVLDQNVLGY